MIYVIHLNCPNCLTEKLSKLRKKIDMQRPNGIILQIIVICWNLEALSQTIGMLKNIIYPSELRTNLDCAIWWKQLCIFARIHWLTKYSLLGVINWRELTEIDSLFHDFFQNIIAFEKCGQNCPNVMSGNVPNGSHLMTSIICKKKFWIE